MNQDKLKFIAEEFIPLLRKLSDTSQAKWGKMNVQQMVEHLSFVFNASAIENDLKLSTPEEHLPKYLEFLYTEKEFRENTKAPESIIGNEPMPLKNESLQKAIDELNKSIQYFISEFSTNGNLQTMHPVFGKLNFDQWVLMHYKHAIHHAKQFNLL